MGDEKKYLGKYRISSTRLQNWDYAWNAWYFVTIKTKNNEKFFGDIENDLMKKTAIGILAEEYWYKIPEHFDFVNLGEFIVMPDHIHELIQIDKSSGKNYDTVETRHRLVSNDKDKPSNTRHRLVSNDKDRTSSIKHFLEINDEFDVQHMQETRRCLVSTVENISNNDLMPGKLRFRNPGKGNLSTIIGSYKSIVSKMAHRIDPTFGWQSRFYDRIVHNCIELMNCTSYIKNNLQKHSKSFCNSDI